MFTFGLRGKCGKAPEAAALPAFRPDERRCELFYDFARVSFVGGIALFAYFSIGVVRPWPGWTAIVVADLYIAAILLSAAIRSDDTYRFRCTFAMDTLYQVMPSTIAALVFVPALFCAVWWGYACVYAALPSVTNEKALDVSFYALAVFAGTENAPVELHSLLKWQTVNAMATLLLIVSMLVNRISEF